MSRLGKIASFALVLGVLAQVALAELPFLRGGRPGPPASVPLATLAAPTSDFIRAHVPAGESIVLVTPSHDVATLVAYYMVSTALVSRNAVWWAVPAPVTHLPPDWWQDVSGGPPAISRFASAHHTRYVVFAGEAVPTALPVSSVWPMNSALAVTELAPAAR